MISMARSRRRDRRPERLLPPPSVMAVIVPALARHLSCGLDMIDMPWLHMTTYIVGFADEVPDPAVEAMTAEARRRLSHVAPIRVSLGRVRYASDAIVLLVEPPGALTPVLDAVREATHAAGCEGHADTDPWLPHISVAYSNATISAAPIISALGRWLPKTEITIRSISLVSQTQVGRSWQWRPVAEVHLAGEPVPTQ